MRVLNRCQYGLAFLCCAALTACDPDTAVFVEATIDSSSVNVEPSGLVTGVSGSIALNLHLGPRATGPSEVALRSISLTNADRSTTIVDTVGALPQPELPVTVGLDSDVNIVFTVSSDDNLLEAAAVDTLCGSGDLTYVIVVEGSLRGGTVTAASDPVTPTGCP